MRRTNCVVSDLSVPPNSTDDLYRWATDNPNNQVNTRAPNPWTLNSCTLNIYVLNI